MWLMTKLGFYSIVEKRTDEYHIRSRSRVDLENLKGLLDSDSLGELVVGGYTDYPFRFITNWSGLREVFVSLSDTIDYPNFKSAVSQLPDQQSKPYGRVWSIMGGGQ